MGRHITHNTLSFASTIIISVEMTVVMTTQKLQQAQDAIDSCGGEYGGAFNVDEAVNYVEQQSLTLIDVIKTFDESSIVNLGIAQRSEESAPARLYGGAEAFDKLVNCVEYLKGKESF